MVQHKTKSKHTNTVILYYLTLWDSNKHTWDRVLKGMCFDRGDCVLLVKGLCSDGKRDCVLVVKGLLRSQMDCSTKS